METTGPLSPLKTLTRQFPLFPTPLPPVRLPPSTDGIDLVGRGFIGPELGLCHVVVPGRPVYPTCSLLPETWKPPRCPGWHPTIIYSTPADDGSPCTIHAQRRPRHRHAHRRPERKHAPPHQRSRHPPLRHLLGIPINRWNALAMILTRAGLARNTAALFNLVRNTAATNITPTAAHAMGRAS